MSYNHLNNIKKHQLHYTTLHYRVGYKLALSLSLSLCTCVHVYICLFGLHKWQTKENQWFFFIVCTVKGFAKSFNEQNIIFYRFYVKGNNNEKKNVHKKDGQSLRYELKKQMQETRAQWGHIVCTYNIHESDDLDLHKT